MLTITAISEEGSSLPTHLYGALEECGLTVVSANPPLTGSRWTNEQMERLDLAALVLPRDYWPAFDNSNSPYNEQKIERRNVAIERIERLGGGTTVRDLTRRTLESFIETHHRLNMKTNWKLTSAILRFMIKNGLGFSNMHPANLLQHPITKKQLGSLLYNRLASHDIWWLELLQFVTENELRDIRNVGDKSITKIVALLDNLGLTLRQEPEG